MGTYTTASLLVNATYEHDVHKGRAISGSASRRLVSLQKRYQTLMIGLICLVLSVPAMLHGPGNPCTAMTIAGGITGPVASSNIGIEAWNHTWDALVPGAWGMCTDGAARYTVGRSSVGGGSMSLIKWDTRGGQVWSRTFGPIAGAQGYGVYSDGTFVYTCGYVVRPVTYADLVVVKWTGGGDVVWNATWGGTGTDIGYGITGDSAGIYVVGSTNSFQGRGDEDIVLIHLAANGTILHNSTWRTAEEERAYDVLVMDGGIYVSGYTGNASAQDMLLARFEPDLTRSMNATWGLQGYLDGGFKAWSDGTNIYVVGQTSPLGNSQMALVKWTGNGSVAWNVTWGGVHNDVGVGISGLGSHIVTVGYSDSHSGMGAFDAVIHHWSSGGILLENATRVVPGSEYASDCAYDGFSTTICGEHYVDDTWKSFIVAYESTDAGPRLSDVITLSVPTPFDDYNVRLDLDSSTFDYSACATGGANIRFYDPANVSMSYWIESWDPLGNSTLWIKVPAAGTRWLVMECGPLFLPAASDGDATFPFFDDFSGATVNPSKWVVYEDTYGHVSVSGGVVTISMATPDNVMHNAELGFTNDHAASGEAFGNRNDDGVVFSTNNMATYRDYTHIPQNLSLIPFDFYMRWMTTELAWINSSLVRFTENRTIIGEITNSSTIPDAPIPLRFVTFGCYYGPGTWWCAYISSVNASMGQPGMAMRARSFSEFYVRSEPATILTDWVFTRRCAAVEPLAIFDEAEPIIQASCGSSLTAETGSTASITWKVSDASPGTFSIERGGVTLLTGSFDAHAGTVIPVDTAAPGLFLYTFNARDVAGNEAWLTVTVVISDKGSDTSLIMVIVIIAGVGVGIATSTRYARRKAGVMAAVVGKTKDGTLARYSGVHPDGAEEKSSRVDAKRARLIQLSPDAAMPVNEPPASPFAKSQVVQGELVDLRAREENAAAMDKETNLQASAVTCIVHKGPVSGFGYTCPGCGVHYCVPCVKHVASMDGRCWNCKAPVDKAIAAISLEPTSSSSGQPAMPIPKDEVGILARAVWVRIVELQREGWITPDVLAEVLAEVKSLPPLERMGFLDDLPTGPRGAYLQPGVPDDEDEEPKN